MLQLTDFIQVFPDAAPTDICESIIRDFEQHSQKEHHDTEGYKFEQLNVTQFVPQLSDAFLQAVVPYFGYYFEQLNNDFVDLKYFEEVRIKKYQCQTNDRFDTHVDVVDHATARRFLVAMLYLNDNDGDTYFPHLDLSIKPEQGKLVLFPPTWMFPHGGKTPTNYDKYIMMTCAHYA